MAKDGNIKKEEHKSGFWNFIDRIEGDKVVWIIVFMLTLISALAIFSSTSRLTGDSKNRIDLIREHAMFIAVGYGIIWCIYKIKNIKVIRIASQFGFLVSFVLLLILDSHANFGFLKAENINYAWRTLSLFGFQIHVFEVVKVAMVMYLAWALHSYGQDCEAMNRHKKSPTFTIANRLADTVILGFMRTPLAKRILYMYIPVVVTTFMVKPGSNSSMILIGGISILILLIGRMPFKEIAIIISSGVAALALCMGLNYASGGTVFSNMRFEELVSRFQNDYSIERLIEIENDPKLGPKCEEWYEVKNKIMQPYGARIAIHEGGLTGKMSGNSTQKYVVPHMYSDYMFSFIIEEYGLIGGIVVLMLFVSLLARGSFIAKLCQHDFAKYAVGGLSLLISGQAFLHIFVNVEIGPMTGQTLPMISDGSFAFLMFCIAFGIILSISKMARNQIREQEEAVKPLYSNSKDDVQAAMDVLEQIDNQ